MNYSEIVDVISTLHGFKKVTKDDSTLFGYESSNARINITVYDSGELILTVNDKLTGEDHVVKSDYTPNRYSGIEVINLMKDYMVYLPDMLYNMIIRHLVPKNIDFDNSVEFSGSGLTLSLQKGGKAVLSYCYRSSEFNYLEHDDIEFKIEEAYVMWMVQGSDPYANQIISESIRNYLRSIHSHTLYKMWDKLLSKGSFKWLCDKIITQFQSDIIGKWIPLETLFVLAPAMRRCGIYINQVNEDAKLVIFTFGNHTIDTANNIITLEDATVSVNKVNNAAAFGRSRLYIGSAEYVEAKQDSSVTVREVKNISCEDNSTNVVRDPSGIVSAKDKTFILTAIPRNVTIMDTDVQVYTLSESDSIK